MSDVVRETDKAWARQLAYQMSGMDLPHMAAALLEAKAVEAERCRKMMYFADDVASRWLEHLTERAVELRRIAQVVGRDL